MAAPKKTKAGAKKPRRKKKAVTPEVQPNTFTFPDGTVVELMEIPMMLSMDFYNDEKGKPEPPMVEMPDTVGNIEVPDEDDPDYQEKLSKWETDHLLEVVRLCALMGVATQAPPDDPILEKLSFIRPDAKETELQYLWVMSKLTTQDSMGEFVEAVVGQTALTEEGVDAAADPNRFRDLGQREASNGAQVQEPALVGDSGTNAQ